MKEKTNGIGIAMVYVGTLIGAGFASGQELYQFFARFGLVGLVGICAAGGLFTLVGFIVLSISKNEINITSEKIMLPIRSKPLERALSIFLGLFLFAITVVMLAGSGALFLETYNLSPWIGSAVMMAASLVTVLMGRESIIKSFKLAVPLLVFGMLAVVIFSLIDSGLAYKPPVPKNNGGSWVISTILFVSYNMVLAVSVLVPLGKKIRTKAAALLGAWVSGTIIGNEVNVF